MGQGRSEPTPDVLELCALSTDILKACVPQSGTPRLGDHRGPYSVVGFGSTACSTRMLAGVAGSGGGLGSVVVQRNDAVK